MNFLVFFPVLFVMELFQSMPNKNAAPGNLTQPQLSNGSSPTPTSPLQVIHPFLTSSHDPDLGLALDEAEDDSAESAPKTKDELTADFRRAFIRQMALEALHQKRQFDASLITSMSTLWTMSHGEPLGPIHEEFYRGRFWIDTELSVEKLNLERPNLVSEILGSLLSCYALTGDSMYLEKAKEIAGQIPRTEDRDPAIAWINSKLELEYLRHLSGGESTLKVNDELVIDLAEVKQLGLLEAKDRLLVLAKSLTQSHQKSTSPSAKLLKDALDYFDRTGSFKSSGEVCIEEMDLRFCRPGRIYLEQMGPGHCNLGAMYAIGADRLMKSLAQSKKRSALKKKRKSTQLELTRIARYWELADALTESCHQMVNETSFGLSSQEGPENPSALAESYFILWRLTRQVKYRDYAWQLATTLYRNSHLHRPRSPPDFLHLSTTFKYLYLTFSHDHLLPLEQWIFTPAGQPLPICGTHRTSGVCK